MSDNKCGVCKVEDEQPMVQCDDCDKWFHFVCVGVNENVKSEDWLCDACNTKGDKGGASKLKKGAAHEPKKCGEVTMQQISARQVIPRDLTTFTGTPEEWPLFISNFEHSTRVGGFTKDENLLRLQRAIKGRALDYVKSSLMLPELVPEIIDTLRMVFGRTEQIIGDLIAKLRATSAVNSNKLESLIEFDLQVKNMTASMKAAKLESYLSSPILLQELIQKHPPSMRLDWTLYCDPSFADLQTFSSWLLQLATAASSVMPTALTSGNYDAERRRPQRVNFQHNTNIKNNVLCYSCKEIAHELQECQRFSSLPLSERWDIIKQNKICRTCLRVHDLRNCPNRKSCGVNQCTAKHHPLLHKLEHNRNLVAVQVSLTSGTLFRIAPVTILGKGKTINTYALFDDGSAPTLVESDLLRELGIQGEKTILC